MPLLKHLVTWQGQLGFSELNSVESTESIEFVKTIFIFQIAKHNILHILQDL